MPISASKSVAIQQLIDDLMEFSGESMRWCSDASEDATRQIATILGHLTDEAKRVASMSAAAVAAVEALRRREVAAEGRTLASGLIESLQKIAAEHRDVREFVDPIIQALQFQDRVTQMMNNIVRMIACWAIERDKVAASDAAGVDLVAFGKALLDCTTMVEERDIIRQRIAGLPPEAAADAVTLF